MSVARRISTRWKIAIAFGVFGLCGVAVVVKLFAVAYQDDQMFDKLHSEKVLDMPSEDSILFSKKAWSKMRVEYGRKDIYRQVTFLRFDGRYQIIVAKFPIAGKDALKSMAKLEFGNGKETNFVMYQPSRLDDHGDFGRRYTPLTPISNILITYSGGIAENVISNDSVVQYRIPCENISIRYTADSPVDMYLTSGNSNSNNADLRLDIVLIKRREKLYFLFVLPVDYARAIEPVDVRELLKK
jgi:hypothetical protein